MTLARRHVLTAGLATLTAGATAAPIKALWDVMSRPALKGLTSEDIAEEAMAPPPPLSSFATSTRRVVAKGVSDVRRAFLHNTHTGDVLDVVYYENGRYVAGALAEATHALRDWRNNQQHFIHPQLFDLLHDLRAKLETKAPFQIWSGYRSAATNAMMHARSEQVASKSQHVLGKALDLTVEGVRLDHLHKAALSLRAGGVGFYPESGFVHVDVGPLRQWSGT